MQVTPSSNQQDFQARLNRISSGRTETVEGLVAPQRTDTQDVRLTGGLLENAMYPLSLVGAFMLGLLAVFMGRFVRVHTVPLADPETDMMMALVADGGIALCVGFAIRQLFRLEGAEWISAQTAGVTVMVASMHNLFFLDPALFSAIFTPDYVAQIMSYTEYRTLVFAGYMFPF